MTGGDDGFIKLWTVEFSQLYYIDVNKHCSDLGKELHPAVTSISWGEDKFAFGTRSGEIYVSGPLPSEVQDNEEPELKIDIRVLVTGHSDAWISGIALSYVAPEMYTVGSNNLILHWDYDKHILLRHKKVDFPAKLLSISLNNNFLVVGCLNGTVLVLSPTTFGQVHAHNSEKKEITALSFSPSNEYIAVGYVNGVVNVLSSTNSFKLSFVIRNANMNKITSLDFSDDNCILRASFSDLKVVFYNVEKSTVLRDDQLRKIWEESWGQWRSRVGWEVKGIWSEYSDPSLVQGINRNHEKDIIIVWDDYGGVKAYKYPCLHPHSPFIRLTLGSGKVTDAVFSYDNRYLFLVGKTDSLIAQFKLRYDSTQNQLRISKYQDASMGTQETYEAEHQTTSRGVVTYLATLPSLWPSKLDPSWLTRDFACINMEILTGVGVNTKDFKTPILAANDDSLIYFCGTTFVRHQVSVDSIPARRTFAHFHKRSVSAMDISKSSNFVATGESVSQPDEQAIIVVHDFEKNEIISQVRLNLGESCIFVKFNPSETQLLVVSHKDGYYRVTLFDWINTVSIQSSLAGDNKINDICFRNDEEFATVGNNHCIFWTIDGKRLDPQVGDYDVFRNPGHHGLCLRV